MSAKNNFMQIVCLSSVQIATILLLVTLRVDTNEQKRFSPLHYFDPAECNGGDKYVTNRAGRQKRLKRIHFWPFQKITYRISKYSQNLGDKTVDMAIGAAFHVWAEVTPLKFKQLRCYKAHIDIRFESEKHNSCEHVFGKTHLAHSTIGYRATTPNFIHFNDGQRWSAIGSYYDESSLFETAMHEIGHILGLLHSENERAVMHPSHDFRQGLEQDDITNVQSIYGKPKRRRKHVQRKF